MHEGHRARRRFNWHGSLPNDGCLVRQGGIVCVRVCVQCLSLSVSEWMTAICHFHRLFSAACAGARSFPLFIFTHTSRRRRRHWLRESFQVETAALTARISARLFVGT